MAEYDIGLIPGVKKYVKGTTGKMNVTSEYVMNVTRDEDGITTMSIYDFLLKENSLEL